MNTSRRSFLHATLAATVVPALRAADAAKAPLFKISLAEWSFHNALGKGEMKNTDFPIRAKRKEKGVKRERGQEKILDKRPAGDKFRACPARSALNFPERRTM